MTNVQASAGKPHAAGKLTTSSSKKAGAPQQQALRSSASWKLTKGWTSAPAQPKGSLGGGGAHHHRRSQQSPSPTAARSSELASLCLVYKVRAALQSHQGCMRREALQDAIKAALTQQLPVPAPPAEQPEANGAHRAAHGEGGAGTRCGGSAPACAGPRVASLEEGTLVSGWCSGDSLLMKRKVMLNSCMHAQDGLTALHVAAAGRACRHGRRARRAGRRLRRRHAGVFFRLFSCFCSRCMHGGSGSSNSSPLTGRLRHGAAPGGRGRGPERGRAAGVPGGAAGGRWARRRTCPTGRVARRCTWPRRPATCPRWPRCSPQERTAPARTGRDGAQWTWPLRPAPWRRVAYLDALDAKAQVGGCMLLAGCAHCVVCHLMYDCWLCKGTSSSSMGSGWAELPIS